LPDILEIEPCFIETLARRVVPPSGHGQIARFGRRTFF
jgi:hypothetical protein